MDTNQKRHLPKWARRKEARPSEILNAALAAFAEKGYAATTMEEIASRANIAKGTIYLYFENKEDVFKSLVCVQASITHDTIQHLSLAFNGSVFEFLEKFYRWVEQATARSDLAVLVKVVMSESGNFPELARFWQTEVTDRTIGLIAAMLSRGIERGELRQVPTEFVAQICMAVPFTCFAWKVAFEHPDTPGFDYHDFLTTFQDVLFQGLTETQRLVAP